MNRKDFLHSAVIAPLAAAASAANGHAGEARLVTPSGNVVPWRDGTIDYDTAMSLHVDKIFDARSGEEIRRVVWARPAEGTLGVYREEWLNDPVAVDDVDEWDAIMLHERPFVVTLEDGSRIYSRGA